MRAAVGLEGLLKLLGDLRGENSFTVNPEEPKLTTILLTAWFVH